MTSTGYCHYYRTPNSRPPASLLICLVKRTNNKKKTIFIVCVSGYGFPRVSGEARIRSRVSRCPGRPWEKPSPALLAVSDATGWTYFSVFYYFFLPHEKRHILTPSPHYYSATRTTHDIFYACNFVYSAVRRSEPSEFIGFTKNGIYNYAFFFKPVVYRLKTPNVEKTKITSFCTRRLLIKCIF